MWNIINNRPSEMFNKDLGRIEHTTDLKNKMDFTNFLLLQ